MIDVGGGHGTLLAALLTAHPSITGVLFDQPAVVENAERVFADAGVSSRATVVGGDFFSELPSRGDLYLSKSLASDGALPNGTMRSAISKLA